MPDTSAAYRAAGLVEDPWMLICLTGFCRADPSGPMTGVNTCRGRPPPTDSQPVTVAGLPCQGIASMQEASVQ